MKIKVGHLTELLCEDISLLERGLLFTILMSKDSDSRIMLAKVKTRVKIRDVKEELIHLHELQLIEWSGYKSAIKSKDSKLADPKVIEIIGFMNNLYRRAFDPKSKSTTKHLANRLKDHTVEEIKKVIANRYVEWKDSATMSKHLNPTTLFRPSKFDKYLEVAKRTREGESFIHASDIGLKNGQEITLELSKNFIDDDLYHIRTYRVNDDGSRAGNGMLGRRYGKEIKKTLKIQDRMVKQGNQREFIYTYKTN